MEQQRKQYLAIDLKSFYASVECVERGLDPLTTHLVVADESRTDKTICLAVSPSLKSYGIPGRPRLFEVKQAVEQINLRRLARAPARRFDGSSVIEPRLRADPRLKLDFVIAPPQMAHYMDCSAGIYQTYLNYVAPEDIHVYSIDEVFIDVTPYLNTYKCSAHELAIRMIRDVLHRTGITATAGIGTNLYLCKVAMDIVAKKLPADKDVPHKDQIRALRAFLSEILPDVEEAGTSLNIEYLPRTCLGNTPDELEEIVDGFPPDRIGICLDVNHASPRTEMMPELIRRLGPRINSFHISDTDGVDECHWFPGFGIVDWPACMGEIRALTRDVLLILEVTGVPFPNWQEAWHHNDRSADLAAMERNVLFLENAEEFTRRRAELQIP